MHILIRTDASVQIGTGHIMRCLTLADELRGRGAEVVFVCREFAENLCGYIEEKGYVVYRLPVSDAPEQGDQNIVTGLKHAAWLGADWQIDARQVEEIIKELEFPPEWLVVDHYVLDERWERYLRPYVKKIMVIDDLADRAHDCDLLLDQNFYDNLESRYDGLVPSSCKKLLGPKYALLRPEFREARKNLRKRDGHVKRIMIFFGGSDPTDETSKALEAIRMLNRPDIAVDVVVGSANPHKDKINEVCAAMTNVDYYCQIENMAQLVVDADLAIGAVGVTALERLSLRLPALVLTIAENQEQVARDMAKFGALFNLGKFSDVASEDMVHELNRLFVDNVLLAVASDKAQNMVDGFGVQRASREILVGHKYIVV